MAKTDFKCIDSYLEAQLREVCVPLEQIKAIVHKGFPGKVAISPIWF
ncbi:hypothetical protein [Phyllobacterium sp. SB3]